MFRKFKVVKVNVEKVMGNPSYIESINKSIEGENRISSVCDVSDIIDVTLRDNQSILLSYPNGTSEHFVEYMEKQVKEFIEGDGKFIAIPNEFNFFVV